MSALPLRVTASSFFRFECDHEQLFQSEYKRSNRTKGLKILRCFPHCCPEHIDRSYCGSSLSVSIRLAEHPVGAVPPESRPSEVLAVFARFEAVSDVSLRTGECVEVDKIQRGVQTDSNLDGQWIAGILDRPSALVVPIQGLDPKSSDGKPMIFHLNNKAFPRWYYDWESGANKAQRLMKHKLIAYVMERVAVDTNDKFTTIASQDARTQLYRVLHVVSSTEFTVISYRRAPLDVLQTGTTHLVKEHHQQNVRGESTSPNGLRPMEVSDQPSTYPLLNDVNITAIARKRDVSGWNRKLSSPSSGIHKTEAKRRRRGSWTRSSDQENVHPLRDQLFWSHTNASTVAVSKNLTLLLAFVRWVPIRLYAPFIDELVDSLKLMILDTSAHSTNPTKLDCFSRLLLQHARSEENSRTAEDRTSAFELETLLRVASQTVLWLFSYETRRWMRAFFCLNATLILDKKAMRRCFVQFLRKVEEYLNVEVLATSTFRNLSNVADQVIAAVYSNECFYDRRPLVRQILSGHTFAGWGMFVAQLRDTYIATTSVPVSEQYTERELTFQAAFPPHSALEGDLNGEWLLELDETQWDLNGVSSSSDYTMNANNRGPDISLSSLIELMSQIIQFEVAVDIQESSLRVRASRSLAGRLHCMHLVLDGKARVFRMLPNGMSSCAGVGALGDYFGEMRVEAPCQVVILLEAFKWSLEEGIPSYHVRTCIEFHRNGRLTVSGDILATTGPSTFTAEEIPYVGEMSLRAKRELVEKASARRFHAASIPRELPITPWEDYGRFRLCYRKPYGKPTTTES